jgi:hypothetical protein
LRAYVGGRIPARDTQIGVSSMSETITLSP